MSKLKYNLGYGDFPLDGYENIDIKDGNAAYPLNIESESADEIRASHLLEHFGYSETSKVIYDWASKLIPGGTLKIAVPDFAYIVEQYKKKSYDNVLQWVVGGQIDENDCHKAIFDKASLKELLEQAGLEDVKEWNDEQDTCRLPVSLNLMGTKPKAIEKPKTMSRKVGCVISMPRLCFSHNANCMIRELAMRGIECTTGTGAFWHQVLTNIIEQEIEKRPDYILTLDYDTWFKFEHVQHMLALMESSDADAIVTSQVKREANDMLLSCDQKQMSREQYESGLFPITGGHFGCTLFRVSAFDKMQKPWFKPIEGPDGGWDNGRTDADIYFWRNFTESGLKAYLAPKLSIGHLQIMATFPGTFENGFKPVHCYMNDVEKGNIPEHVLEGLK